MIKDRIYTNIISTVTIFAFFIQFGCQKREIPISVEAPKLLKITEDGYKSEYVYNVNIVYLIPSDMDTVVNYKKRLSELFLWSQNWTKNEMARHGYADKTFGLLVNDNNQVKIHVVRSKFKHSELPYESKLGGADKAEKEVNDYLNTDKNRQSDHTIILYPSAIKSDGYTAIGGTPFYGRGKICHALDYEAMTLANVSSEDANIRREVRKWFGGMIHELFHGLNLPHNSETAEEAAAKKVALMRDHYNYGPTNGTETILTAADAAIFSTTQVFSKTERQFYGATNRTLELDELSYHLASKSIIFKGRYQSDVNVKKVIVYIDPSTEGKPALAGNTNYNAITFVTNPINQSFSFAIPIASLKELKPTITNHLYVGLVFENGAFSSGNLLYPFKFNENKEPQFDLKTTLGNNVLLEKTDWKIQSFSSEHKAWNNYAKYTIDNDPQTSWYPSASTLPHEIVIDLNTIRDFDGFVWSNILSGNLRPAKDVEVLTTNRLDSAYTSLGTFTLVDTRFKQYVVLNQTGVKARYIKFIVKSTHEGNSYLYVSEIDLFRKK